MAVKIFSGERYKDERGTLTFFNSYDMSESVRFYTITPASKFNIRGWQAHQNEKKWFYCLSGSFNLYLVKVDDFNHPSNKCEMQKVSLNSEEQKILLVPGGYATAIKAMYEGSSLQVFSNFKLEESKQDDFRYPLDKWQINLDE